MSGKNWYAYLRAASKNQIYFLLSLPAVVWPIIFLVIPLALLLAASGMGNSLTVTREIYNQIANLDHAKIIGRSLLLGIMAASGCLVCVYPMAYFIAVTVRSWSKVFLFFLMVPLWTNFLVQLYGWQFLLEPNGLINTILQRLVLINTPIIFTNSLFTVGIVMIYCYIPFMFVPIYSVLLSFDKRLLEASSDLGASTVQTFFRVTLPLSLSGIRAGFILTFVLGYGEFAIPALIGGGKFMTVGSLITYYFLTVGDSALGAAFTCLSGLVLCGAAFLLYVCFNQCGKRYVGLAR